MSKDIKRREFLILAAATLTNPKMVEAGSLASPERVVDVGPVNGYVTDGVYAGFRNQGFFVVRKGKELFALSALCTHRKCKLSTQSDHSFYCPCHGSAFDPGGKVIEGPAARDLPQLPSSVSEKGHLLVKVPA
jgi:Rieske Fe-S protein